ncbi:MAG: alpha-mannosidase [Candidatus Binatia bacterium]
MHAEPQPETNRSLPVHLVVVPHTHWDREWYQPFQQFRSRLVRMIDRLLETLEGQPDFTHFHLDGQTIVLEDYLDIRPRNRARLRRLIRTGRIAVGPWYVLPDEFLVTGESLIRNLQIGHRLAAEFGTPLKVGYLPDQFGHIAQMPQILAGFGIDCAVVWRGVGAGITRTLFTWEAPDGTSVFTVYLPHSGYSNGRGLPEAAGEMRERLAAIVAEQAPYRRVQSLLLMNGTDHQEAQATLPGLLAAATRGSEGLSYEITSLSSFIERVRAEHDELQTHRGELRSPLRAHLLPGVTSARVRQKQRDFYNASRLERYAEPLATWADLTAPRPCNGRLTDFTDWAWNMAVQNHPHDSICGCSIDAVHRDMEYRFDQVEMVGEQVTRQALAALVQRLDTSGTAPDPALCVYNSNTAGPSVVRAEIYADPASSFVLQDERGREIPIFLQAEAGEVLFAAELPPDEIRPHVLAIQTREFLGFFINDAAFQRQGDRLSVVLTMDRALRGRLDVPALRKQWLAMLDDPTLRIISARAQTGAPARATFIAPELTGHGFKVFALRRRTDGPREAAASPFIATGGGIENHYYRISVDDDGALSITDKETNLVLQRCNWFVDEGDRGDEYNFDPLAAPQAVMAPASRPTVTIDTGNSVVATLTVDQTYLIPRRLEADRDARSSELVPVPITTRIHLYAGIKRVDFETRIDNTAADHRLRVHFQTPLTVGSAFMEQAFGAVERALDLEPEGSVERPIGTVPQKTFTCIQDGRRGVALFNRGIPEVEVFRTDGGTEIVLTLIRAVGWLSRGDLRWRNGHAGPGLETPEAQSQGPHRFEYALTTYSGDWESAGVVTQAHNFAHPPIALVTDARPGSLPAGAALFRCGNPNIVVSAVTPAKRNGAYVIRCYNASSRAQTGIVEFFHAGRARAVNFLERPVRIRMRRLRDGALRLQLRPFEIATLQVSGDFVSDGPSAVDQIES